MSAIGKKTVFQFKVLVEEGYLKVANVFPEKKKKIRRIQRKRQTISSVTPDSRLPAAAKEGAVLPVEEFPSRKEKLSAQAL